tara:strand:+ start:3473 stop:4111 length:639 start_codon:yes stop_codon:yes gene_type:complete
MNHELFDDDAPLPIGDGAFLLRGFALSAGADLLSGVDTVTQDVPARTLYTPGGHRMSVETTSCGRWGWVSDEAGYRYAERDPATGRAWPAMPEALRRVAVDAATCAGYPGFDPDTCLINRYTPGARMGLHQDRNEDDFSQPIVSVSLGLPIIFQFGGMQRSERPRRVPLSHGDVVVWGGPTRLAFHGVLTLRAGIHPLAGAARINLTFRRAR